jgi:hypothetical protein
VLAGVTFSMGDTEESVNKSDEVPELRELNGNDISVNVYPESDATNDAMSAISDKENLLVTSFISDGGDDAGSLSPSAKGGYLIAVIILQIVAA